MAIRRLAVACGLTLLLPGIAHANGAMGLAYSIFPYATWLVYVAATVVFEAWWIGRALRMPLRTALGHAVAANAVTLALGIVFSGLFGYLVNGVFSSRLNPNPLGQSALVLLIGGLVSALIEAPFWSTTVRAPFWRSNGHKPPWRASVAAHLLGVPLALAILLVPERPYRGLESQAEHARNRLVRQDLERALSQSISETERIPAVRTYSELLERLRPKLTKYITNDPDLWAAAYVPHFRRFDTGERQRDPVEWNAAVAGKRIGDLAEPTWLVRWIYVDLGGVARPQGIVTEGWNIRPTRDPRTLGYSAAPGRMGP